MLTVRLPKELEDKLGRLAAATSRTKSFFVKEALQRYLEDLDDAYVALDRVLKPGAGYYTTEETRDELGL